MERWAGRTAVVTGASEGIGAAIVRRLAESGMKVAALARRRQLLQELERETKGIGGVVKGYTCDVSNTSDVVNAFQAVRGDLGPVSILVNNAALLRHINLADTSLEDTKAIIDTNLMGVVKCCKEAIASMREASVGEGHIINISSMAVYMDTKDWPEYGMYAASKAAVNKLSKSLKDQLRKDGLKIRVTVVCPGLVKTSMVSGVVPDFSVTPHLLPADIADAVAHVIGAPPHVDISEILMNPT